MRRHWTIAAWLLLSLSVFGCRSTHTQPPLFDALDLPITLTEFRIRVTDFSEFTFAVLENAAEEIIDTSEDQQVRRNAMEWRLRAIAIFLNALNQPEPAAALIDAWAFCLQLAQFVDEDGAGATLFGDEQYIAINATSRVAVEVEQVVVAIAQEDPTDGRALVETWVAQNPLVDELLVRRSTSVLLSEQLESRDDSLFAALGNLQTGVEDLALQMQRYISVMPRTVRWQTQLILHETLYDEARVDDMLRDLDLITANALDLYDSLDLEALPDKIKADLLLMLAEIQPLIDEERANLVAELDRQRALIFEDVTRQREGIMVDVEQQILDIDRQIQGRIDEMFDRIEALTDETLGQSFGESERLINLIYRRSFTLLLVALAGGAGLVLLFKWRHPGRAAAGKA